MFMLTHLPPYERLYNVLDCLCLFIKCAVLLSAHFIWNDCVYK